ncbi:hypothetical protein BAU15_00085 [Enterococcus sp. JM4C]|uniref:AbrB/MazE/SpoVT family DNA-binding domain-containing protein n=1 Tax=Candidatus Enterococcus huntleyi TaxID=1857217 RepID=UPI00137B7F21|nr:toxin-antitoxin system, antitoxin component, AbrB family protein [Enterococcus sp. JM4C]KAF1299080.1 hypothetical protein BAU15_00085 [Enterococcus sp. JM4C]
MKIAIKEIKKWGNSKGILLSKADLEQLGAKDNNKLQMTISNGKITLVPITDEPKTFDDLFIGYDGEPLGDSDCFEWGGNVGREIL